MRIRKILWLTIALIAFTLGAVGIALPILPTVPLYLLAALGFANSSERLHNRFLNSRLYKRYLLPYRQAGGLPLKVKRPLVLWVTIQIGIALFLVRHSRLWLIVLLALYAGFLFSMRFIVKTIPPKAKNNPHKKSSDRSRESL